MPPISENARTCTRGAPGSPDRHRHVAAHQSEAGHLHVDAGREHDADATHDRHRRDPHRGTFASRRGAGRCRRRSSVDTAVSLRPARQRPRRLPPPITEEQAARLAASTRDLAPGRARRQVGGQLGQLGGGPRGIGARSTRSSSSSTVRRPSPAASLRRSATRSRSASETRRSGGSLLHRRQSSPMPKYGQRRTRSYAGIISRQTISPI